MPDQWGPLQIPTQASQPGFPAGDPALRYILDFFFAFVVTDANATDAWSTVYPSTPPILNPRSTFAHDPRALPAGVFSTSWLPALFMWRESARQEYAAEDWLRETTDVKALWVFPLALPENQRQRVPFEHALVKAIVTGLERGQTPGYVVPGDPNPRAAIDGSVMYDFAAFESFSLESWKHVPVTIDMADKGNSTRYPAIEMSFVMQENFVYGLDRFATNSPTTGVSLTLTGLAGAAWVTATAYHVGAYVVPSVANGLCYTATAIAGTGTSGATEPVWPKVVGATVVDNPGPNQITWTCSAGTTRVAGPL